jgi:hypothetical protein
MQREAGLERGAISGEINPTVAIFALKQLGWRDKHEVESTSTEVIHYITEEADKPADAGTG